MLTCADVCSIHVNTPTGVAGAKAMEGADSGKLHGSVYSDALSEVKHFLNSPTGMPKGKIVEMHAKLKAMAAQPLDDAAIMHPGQPWGALEMMRQSKVNARSRARAQRHAPGHANLSAEAQQQQQPAAGGAGNYSEHAYVWPASTPFAFKGWKDSVQAKPWVELLEAGEFSPSTLAQMIPPSYQVADAWMVEVKRSKPTWLRALYLGIGSMETAGAHAEQNPDFAEARAYLGESYRLKANPIAARCLAVSAPTPEQAARNFSAAWDAAVAVPVLVSASPAPVLPFSASPASLPPSLPSPPPSTSALKVSGSRETLLVALASEICSFYLEVGYARHLDAFLEKIDAAAVGAVPAVVKTSETVLFAKATRAMQKKECKVMRTIIASSRFPTFFDTGRTQIASLWLTCAVIDEEAKLGHPLSSVERHRVRVSKEGEVSKNIGPFKGTILPH